MLLKTMIRLSADLEHKPEFGVHVKMDEELDEFGVHLRVAKVQVRLIQGVVPARSVDDDQWPAPARAQERMEVALDSLPMMALEEREVRLKRHTFY